MSPGRITERTSTIPMLEVPPPRETTVMSAPRALYARHALAQILLCTLDDERGPHGGAGHQRDAEENHRTSEWLPAIFPNAKRTRLMRSAPVVVQK